MGGGSSVRKKAPVEPAPQAPSVSRGFAERELATVATKRAPPPGPSVVHSEYGYSLLHVTPPGAFDLKQLRQVEEGERGSVGYRLFLQYGGKRISPWHDIPLLARPDDDGTPTYHFLCEIPKGTNAKLEMDKEKELNPITHDLRHGKPRYYKYNPEVGCLVNYGALMQTWEDPKHMSPDTNCIGDGDPVDACMINARPSKPGAVHRVRVLGTLALIDEGETDWKLIVVDAADPAQQNLRDIYDVPSETIHDIREWFRLYKTAEGKPQNKFGLGEKAMDAAYARSVVDQTHQAWRKLLGT